MSEVPTEALPKENPEDKTDPGASLYGNFMNYYQFHPAEERVRQLPRDVWWSTSHPARKYVGLDIGCNAGDLTFALHDFLEKALSKDQAEVSLLGVDLDPILIERARERNPRVDRMIFECLDFMSEERNQTVQNYLQRFRKTRFDVVFCFSITMWIHLNYGDSGLVEFLRRACSITEMIVVEPQHWKSYKNAERRLRRSKGKDFPFFVALERTGNVVKTIQDMLENIFDFQMVAITEGNAWKRNVLIYKRK